MATTAKTAKKTQDSSPKRASRTRNYATVVYPESAPADWLDRLDALHITALVSPLHDKDTNPSGEPKKPHYHVLLMFESPKDYETQIKPIFADIGGVGREAVNSSRGYARYLCHLDNPEKAQYSPSDVRCMGGANYQSIVSLPTDDIQILGDIFAFIEANSIYSLAELLSLCRIHHPDWFATIAMSRGYIVDKYIKSLAWESQTGYVRAADRGQIQVDKSTGEVLDQQCNGNVAVNTAPLGSAICPGGKP